MANEGELAKIAQKNYEGEKPLAVEPQPETPKPVDDMWGTSLNPVRDVPLPVSNLRKPE